MFQENNVKKNTNNTSMPLRDLNIADLRNLVATFPNFKTLITPPSDLSLEHLNKSDKAFNKLQPLVARLSHLIYKNSNPLSHKNSFDVFFLHIPFDPTIIYFTLLAKVDTTAILSKGSGGIDFSYKWTLRFSKNLIYFGDSHSKMCFMIRLEDLPKRIYEEKKWKKKINFFLKIFFKVHKE
jgi:hypothetical protein